MLNTLELFKFVEMLILGGDIHWHILMNKNDSKLNSTKLYFTVLGPLLVIIYINGKHTALRHSENKNNRDKLRPKLTITFTIKQKKSTRDQTM